ncbi:small serum protein 5-like [Pantherophis guttatus]|uniref:Small serum protein 5-like n=1 Tax=Pantherophis guttatus TaxID=94885 RepID=A0ABM3YT92_PANGU|nr:small serum protein 5-like [Pantherophis guttatus]XP_060539337.1 small serum protein 5-like [Pantherophis guttatus]
MFSKAKMRVFFSLIVLSFMLAKCHGACMSEPFKPQFINGKEVWPTNCVDPFDGKKHPIGSKWNTDDCMSCNCLKDGLTCCHRYGGIAVIEGCKTVINPETCKHEFYRLDDPSKRCDV